MMKLTNVLVGLFVFIPSFLWGNPNQQLSNQQWAYYGKDFYQTKKTTKHSLYQILIHHHQSNPGQYDLIANQPCTNCYQQKKNEYSESRKIIFDDLFKQQDARGFYVQDVYCGKKFYFKNLSEIINQSNRINVEHTWPQSRFSSRFDKELQKADLHHLFPSDSLANNVRANYEFGDGIPSYQDEVESCSPSRVQDISGHIEFTPPKNHKGNVARALFYFSVRYQIGIGQAEELILRQWHKLDPVDNEEIIRHHKIADYQKNRNPFIDFPELVETIADY